MTLVAILVAGKGGTRGTGWVNSARFWLLPWEGSWRWRRRPDRDVTSRGFTDYDFLRSGQAWGIARVDWLASVYLFWLLVLTLWFGKRRPRWRNASFVRHHARSGTPGCTRPDLGQRKRPVCAERSSQWQLDGNSLGAGRRPGLACSCGLDAGLVAVRVGRLARLALRRASRLVGPVDFCQ